jgi:hypothetical protein
MWAKVAGRWSRTHYPSDGYRQALVELLAAFELEAADELL